MSKNSDSFDLSTRSETLFITMNCSSFIFCSKVSPVSKVESMSLLLSLTFLNSFISSSSSFTVEGW